VKVLLVATNRSREPLPVMPYGACLVAEAAERAGHRVELLDLMFEDDPEGALGHALRRMQPDVVAFSVRNIDNNDMRAPQALYRDLRGLVRQVRQDCAASTVIGGPAVGVMPGALLDYSEADWAAVGDGEVVFPKLLAEISAGRTPGVASGPSRTDGGGEVVGAGSACSSPFPEAPLVPDYRRWLRVKAYRAAMAAAPVQTKRGCPFECVYCRYAANEGKRYRLHAPRRVAEAVAGLAEVGLRDVEFVDNVFNSPRDHAVEICEAVAAAGRRARLQTLQLNPAFVDDELLDAMERAGFVAVGITAESASESVLRGLGKNYGAAELRGAAEAVARSALPCLWIFMLGGPGETEASIAETFDFAETHVRPRDAAFFNLGIRIYPGTGLERTALEQGVIDRPAADMLEPVFYLAPGLSRERVERTLDTAVRRRLNFMSSPALAHPLLPKLNGLANRLRLAPPLWRHTATVRRGLRLVGQDIA
jgi:radical SAM superfamily enzyme YgiQ (UPF0313 family)